MQAYFTLIVAFATLTLASSQPGPVSVEHGQQPNVVVSNSPSVDVAPQQSGVVSEGSQQAHSPVATPVTHQLHPVPNHHAQQHYPSASYYAGAPASGLIQVVQSPPAGPQFNKPEHVSGPTEQYGQPESASLPPNYKPFGSWGLYIGGNPADGYYTNYYKQLSNSVDKQQAGVEQASGMVKPFSPLLKQAVSSPFGGGDYYPFAYSMSDLSSVSRQPIVGSSFVEQPSQAQGPVVSPVQAGAQVYGSPASFENNYASVSSYAPEVYATKKFGSAYAQKEVSAVKEAPSAQAPKGYYPQSRVYSYPPTGSQQAQYVHLPAPGQQYQQQQVVAYPVPVGSQMVGSQAGVDGAFSPYGVHAFTRYAVKPTVVGSENTAYHYGVSSQAPVNKQHYSPASSSVYSVIGQQQQQQVGGAQYYPFSYYGYPMNQLHYSQGSIVPAVHTSESVHHNPSVQVEAASEKSESEDKSSVSKQQQKSA